MSVRLPPDTVHPQHRTQGVLLQGPHGRHGACRSGPCPRDHPEEAYWDRLLADALFRERTTFADQEACCRGAISRAYYAAFCAARNHARDNEGRILPHTAQAHQTVFEHYASHANAQHRIIAPKLQRLRRERNRADYNDLNISQVAVLTQNVLD